MVSLATTPSLHMSVDGLCRAGTNDGSTRGAGGKLPSRLRIRKSLSQQGASTSCSIPSRYQTFFYSTTESRGFNSQATRFEEHLTTNENPGPGSYGVKSAAVNSDGSSYYSKQGTGGFASKTRRFPRQHRQELGPGSYNPLLVGSKNDFNKASVSSNFQRPIAVKPDPTLPGSQTLSSPAPNTYNLSGVHTGKNSLVSAEAAFKSRSRRESVPPPPNPAPGQYSVSDRLLHPSPSPLRSVFNSQTKRDGITRTSLGPGPADYAPFAPVIEEPNELKQLPYYKQKHYLCISAPAMPLPPLPPSPGPGHYETQGSLVPADKKLAPDAVFKSAVPRWSGPAPTSGPASSSSSSSPAAAPGPGSYDPKYSRKQSYLYNVQHKWV